MIPNQLNVRDHLDDQRRRRNLAGGHIAVVCGSDLLASALALGFQAEGYGVVLCDRVDPPAIWRGMTFTDAWYVGRSTLAERTACFCASLRSVRPLLARGYIVATTWSSTAVADTLQATYVVDARSEAGSIASRPASILSSTAETEQMSRRRIRVPRALTTLSPVLSDLNAGVDIRASCEGRFATARHIGEHVRKGDCLGNFNGESVNAPCDGVVFGLAARGALVATGSPLAAIDPQDNPLRCFGPDAAAVKIANQVISSLCVQAAMTV